ncbi:hypothetical protein [Streptomyces sp. NBC_01481]|uniref:hypothetical protein n=1 Tax=Streptomyces sp. NBC_01481 TaxID=2975869 RepID=UPI00225BCCB0|nr:hypothetical protein [Streptomyces sp. NBC_01481]MCX4587720.1 hypothetical protein [Streptomyces sp. NBC_01481]
MNAQNHTGGQSRPSNAQMPPIPPQGQRLSERPTDTTPVERPKLRPSWNVEAPSAETAAIATIGVAEAANLAGYVDGSIAGGAMVLGVLAFLVKKCIKRNP